MQDTNYSAANEPSEVIAEAGLGIPSGGSIQRRSDAMHDDIVVVRLCSESAESAERSWRPLSQRCSMMRRSPRYRYGKQSCHGRKSGQGRRLGRLNIVPAARRAGGAPAGAHSTPRSGPDSEDIWQRGCPPCRLRIFFARM